MFKFILEDYVKDIYSGFRGTITTRMNQIDMPNMYFVENLDGNGQIIGYWFSEGRLEKDLSPDDIKTVVETVDDFAKFLNITED